MALKSSKSDSSLELKFKTGELNKNGKDVTKTLKFSKVKPTAADQDIYDVGNAFRQVLVTDGVDVSRVDNTSLVDEG